MLAQRWASVGVQPLGQRWANWQIHVGPTLVSRRWPNVRVDVGPTLGQRCNASWATTIGSDNGLSPGQRQVIIWTNAGILLIGPLGTNLTEILSEIHTFSLKKMHLKISSGKWRPFCLGLNVLNEISFALVCDSLCNFFYQQMTWF